MKVLLDTHAFIWWDDDHTQLSSRALAICQDRENTILLSIASVWEMQIKIQLGKLKFSLPVEDKIQRQQEMNGLEILSISLKHVFTLDQLPHHHRDPFDRLLMAQCINEGIPMISYDSLLQPYPVQIIW